MKIRVLQTGGISPYVTYTPNIPKADTAAATLAAAPAKGDKEEDNELLSKDMIKLIMENGLPSDVDAFMKHLSVFLSLLSSGNPQQLLLAYLQLLPYLNKIKYNRDQMNKASDELYKNGGLYEAAISTTGQVVVKDKAGKVSMVLISKFDPNKYQVVTNSELIKMRGFDSNMAFNNDIVNIILNGQGSKSIDQEIQSIVSQIKAQKSKSESFISPQQNAVLVAADMINGVVKQTVSTETTRTYIKDAMNYIMTMLPQNSKSLLQLKAKQTGLSVNQVLMSYFKPTTYDNPQVEYDFKSNGKTAKDKKEGDGYSGARDVSFLEAYTGNMIGTDYNGAMKTHRIALGTNAGYEAPALSINGLVGLDGKPLNPNSNIKDIALNAFNGVADLNNVYFGEDRVDPANLDRIVSTGANMSKVYLPIDQEEYARTGQIKPNFLLMRELDAVDKEIKRQGITDEGAKMLMYREAGLSAYFKAPVSNSLLFAPFAAILSIAQGNSVVHSEASPLIEKIERTDDIEDIINKGKFGTDSDGTPNKNYLISKWNPMNWLKDTNIYQGLVFMHTPDDNIAASTSANPLTVQKGIGDFNNVMQRQVENESYNRGATIQQNSSLYLN